MARTIQEMEENLLAGSALETATFGMGCFWGPEARFGSLQGVLKTRVGYAGGTIENPTYRKMGDHTETVQIDFNPAVLSYEEVLRHFWRNHYPNRDEYKGRQYISLLRFHDAGQEAAIKRVKVEMEAELGETIETDIASFTDFTPAEARHQKYYLKRYPKVLDQLKSLYSDEQLLEGSTFAARLNGFVKGYGNRETLKREIESWKIDKEDRFWLVAQLMNLKW